jgi:DNA-binding NarL/FixJ family response regulator
VTAASCPVFVVGEIRFYRESLERFLAEQEGIVVLGTAADATQVRSGLLMGEPVTVLLDVGRAEDVKKVREIREVLPVARVIALGVPELERDVLLYAEEGVVGFVGRDRSLRYLLRAIRSAARGELECSASIAGALLRHVARLAVNRRHAPNGVALTPREYEIAALIERGLSNKEIARELHIELATVKNHVHNLLEKFDVSTRGQAAALVRTLPPPR